MKFLSLLVAALTASCSHAFVGFQAPPLSSSSVAMMRWHQRPAFVFSSNNNNKIVLKLSSSDFQSDFASAMPEAPKLTMREYLEQAADKCISNVQGSLGEGVEGVPELDALRALRQDDASPTEEELSIGIYELMIERGMTYDEDPDNGVLTPTDFDIQANLDVPEVKEEFLYLYKYGMNLVTKGFVDVEKLAEVVKKRLIARTGKTPEEFDAWLGF
ncbi:expressed unknown protein [Seminavis robusta]|uniref:Uncharacterized protein n=1 Tax=Seminavis robusta TaxID=568900 RepID=A0A9N8DM47_9STRA|nr:expressed unknown protein [Seminavis robusta]|eukprot:Sro218_g089990.1 n/a (216) ;mRNA; f:18777-19424